MNLLFKKEYSAEELFDMERDIVEAFEGDFNPVIYSIPTNVDGFMQGKFVVTIEWVPE